VVDKIHMTSVTQHKEKMKEQVALGKPVLDPVLTTLHPANNFGAVSESFQKKIEEYMTKDPGGLFAKAEGKKGKGSITKDKFEALMHLKYIASLVAPGEAVGVLAAQGVGEPSTQMTLNTFHLAGHGGANVTLGIPRLREIIMTASDKISTPVMELPLKGASVEEKKLNAYKLAARLDRITLASMSGSLRVKAYISASSGTLRRVYKIRIMFHPIKSKKLKKLDIALKDFADCIDTEFCPKLNAAIIKHHKHLKHDKAVIVQGKKRGGEGSGRG